ncbi:MAG TPA: signal peptide peptidase SppA [Synechococcales cyanobacterium M55_K2018_004]|nr:signal peptide peptidase SppA [Synechococcales cyanobacterium M55_K2018_004]
MRDFLKTVLATITGLILFSFLGLGGLLFLLGAIATTASLESKPIVEDKTVLEFDLSQAISDTTADLDPSLVIAEVLSGQLPEDVLPLRHAIEAIRAAAHDDRIVGLYIHGSVNAESGAGFASLRELREALQEFRKLGKPILAYDMEWSERDYYLASVANTILLNPAGLLEMNGLRSEMMFFAGALEKYGVGIQVVRAGRYKSAVEPFTRTSSSPEDRQQTQNLLADLWNEVLTTTAQSRKLTPQKLQAIADNQGLLMADQAKANGLIDRVAYPDEVLKELQKLTEEKDDQETFRQISLAEYAEVARAGDETTSDNHIALVYAEGDIVNGRGGPGLIGGNRFARLLRELRTDENVKAIVLRINSPGGSAIASDVIAREVLLTRQVKPVIVSLGSIAASGGYQIAASATEIFASPNTITGSIGVYGVLPNFQKIANQNGITWEVVKTGRFADMNTITRPRTAAELAIQQRIVDRIYQNFLNTVAKHRPLKVQQVEAIAQGRVWSGVDAKSLGLVDRLGGIEAAIQAAAKAAKLGDDWQLEEYPKTRSFEEQLFESLFSRLSLHTQQHSDVLTLQLQQLQANLQPLLALDDPVDTYSRLPFKFEIR